MRTRRARPTTRADSSGRPWGINPGCRAAAGLLVGVVACGGQTEAGGRSGEDGGGDASVGAAGLVGEPSGGAATGGDLVTNAGAAPLPTAGAPSGGGVPTAGVASAGGPAPDAGRGVTAGQSGSNGGAAGESGLVGGAGGPPSLCASMTAYSGCSGSETPRVCQDCAAEGIVTQFCVTGYMFREVLACTPHRCADPPVPGAEVACLPGELCVVHLGANEEATRMECIANPCGSSFVDADCASTVVCPEADRWRVQLDDGGIVVACLARPLDCPRALPATGDACPMNAQQCLYQDCAAYGVADARCSDGVWSVDSAACADFDCFSQPALVCAAGEICRIQGGTFYANPSCTAAPDEPGLVAQVGVGLICGGDEWGGLQGGGISLSCYCVSESPTGC